MDSLTPKKSEGDQSTVNEDMSYCGPTEADVEIQELASSLAQATSNSQNHSQNLVRYLSNMSEIPGISPYSGETLDPRLDPESKEFNSKFWVKNLRKLYDSDLDYYKPSSLGVAYRDLRAYGLASDSDYQPTVANAWFKFGSRLIQKLRKQDQSIYFDILKSMDAIMRPGELTVVLGRPGSGCSTLLKTIATRTYGFHVGSESKISYDGFTPKDIESNYRGDVIFLAETDIHFPHLSVGDTLEFAARLRTPQNRGNFDRETYAKHMASVFMATYGLSHTRNTKVGNDIIRGISGGERKRVSIAEASLSGAKLQCWDNATRGLDAATALGFVRALKTTATVLDVTPLIAIYQCSQDAYNLFDNVVVLYEGYQIYYGKAANAKQFFLDMGYECPQRQATADFLTSLTNPVERIVRNGYENTVPRTAKEFEAYWKNSREYSTLIREIDAHFQNCEAEDYKNSFGQSHVARQSRYLSSKSPYTVSFFMQTRYIMGRNFLRTKADPSIALFSVLSQAIMALFLSSVFFNMQRITNSFYYRGAAMFFAVLFNSFASLLEIISLFEARPIVEKHKQFALYRPSADALASIITELPIKLCMSLSFNVILYFMVNFRRDAGRFFFYWLMCGTCTLVMSHLFRCLGAVSKSLPGAMTPATVVLLAMILYTGFIIPTPSMLGWSRWIGYINPVGYVFEALIVNEFDGVEFECSQFVPVGPSYQNIQPDQRICSVVGAQPGSSIVKGTDYIALSFEYYNKNKWRDFGISLAFAIFFLGVYILITEWSKSAMQKGEIALFLRSSLKNIKDIKEKSHLDIESGFAIEKVNNKDASESLSTDNGVTKEVKATSKDIFHWKDLTYQVKIKSEERVILDHVDGWVKPGQLTALMGSTGAGKTTLLNCLSERVTTGIITDGVRMVNGKSLDSSFQRSIGYAQQQDIHLSTSTVREALRFSAYLRQSSFISKVEKDAYVEHIIDLLEMNAYADALVGIAGEGLNIEQRKRLTIGVELVAKPKLLLFLDEPTSGLDSQTAWSICKLLRKLADSGQAILCTIHQPPALLLQEFDRLLFLQNGGQTVYFGKLGENCSTLINYFERNGAHKCPDDANPAEWMLQVVGAAPGSKAEQDYFKVWKDSIEYQEIRKELDEMDIELSKIPKDDSPDGHLKYAASMWKQYLVVTHRAIQQHWRSPTYIYSKIFTVVSAALFNGFSFYKAGTSIQGMQNQMYSVLMFMIPFNIIVDQMLPYFYMQRDIYEGREAPSKTYSWFAFIAGQMSSEIPFQIGVGTLAYFSWYYPVGLYNNAVDSNTVHERGALTFLYVCAFLIYASSVGHFCASFIELVDNAANLSSFFFTLFFLFCGVIAGPNVLPGFWIFMYRCSPFTYFVQGVLASGLAKAKVVCDTRELLQFNPPQGTTCGAYMDDYLKVANGYLANPSATSDCLYCPLSTTDEYLSSVYSLYSERWRNFGIFIAFIFINMLATIFLYWLARVPKGNREKKQTLKK